MAENEKMEQAAKTSSDKADKSKKDKSKNAKPSFFARIGRWLREMKSELKNGQADHEQHPDCHLLRRCGGHFYLDL